MPGTLGFIGGRDRELAIVNPYHGALGLVIGWFVAVILMAMILVFMDRQLFKLEDELD